MDPHARCAGVAVLTLSVSGLALYASRMVELWQAHADLVWLLGVVSIGMLAVSAMLVPLVIVRLPADFYRERDGRGQRSLAEPRVLPWLVLAIKNVLGGILLLAGLLMLFLPGQGILTILVALTLLDFPGKRALELRILRNPTVLRAVNWLRRRAGREPFVF